VVSDAPPLSDRRAFLGYFAGLGLGSTLFPGVLWARAVSGAEVNDAAIVAAAEVAGLTFTDDERKQMLSGLKSQPQTLAALRAVPLDNSVAPAIVFNPLPLNTEPPKGNSKAPVRSKVTVRAVPANLEELCYEPVTLLSELIRSKKITSTALTRMYLARLRRLDEKLKCVVTFTEDRALRQAADADAEIARGKYRGALHGIPWGAKDLFAVKGYPTTWGSAPYKDQQFSEDAVIVQRLDAAGAVLIAKLTLGELANGDVWFGGRTNNPWKLDSGSSGSSAGPGSATAAGCVGFAIGTETLGSISSPSSTNGVTGLRPTFGRVPRTGAMALVWSMDKVGPMARSVEDAALVFNVLHGPDGRDHSCHAAPFSWDAGAPLSKIRVGFVKSAFDSTERHPLKEFDDAALEALRKLGIALIPVELPDAPYNAMRIILDCEAGAAFDELTRSGRVKEMAQQGPGAWPNTFRKAHLIPAVDYINANRVRALAIAKWAELFKSVDVIVTPTGAASQLTATNLTGHPACIVPNGFRDGTPINVSITFLGSLFGEASLLRVAHAYQQATGFHLRHPALG
jgi:Asp-tRNA(Asn)/Glu-tRNA(Gln) amidotransferase A subunit family amidase